MSSLSRHNPMPLLVWTVLAALALGMLALFLIGSNPPSLGSLLEDHLAGQAYVFDRLELAGQYLRLEIETGQLVPVIRGSQVSGVIVLGRGSYLVELPPEAVERFTALTGLSVLEDGFRALYLPLDYQGLEDLKALALARQADDPDALTAAGAVLARNREDPALLRIFGVVRRFATGPTSLARVEGYGYPEVFYTEGETVEITVPSLGPGGRFSLEAADTPASFFAAPPPAPAAPHVTLGILGTGVLLCLALTYALTADLDPPRRFPVWSTQAYLVGLVLVPATDLAGRCLLRGLAWGEPTLHVALALGTLAYARTQGWHPAYLGLTFRRLGRSILVGLCLGCPMVLGAALALPVGLRPHSPGQLAALAVWSFLVAGLLPEIYLRGLVHNALERLGGAPLAIPAAALFAGFARGLPRLLAVGFPSPALWVETLLAAPLAFVVAGYLYHRTRNVFAPATALWLLAFLPEVLRF